MSPIPDHSLQQLAPSHTSIISLGDDILLEIFAQLSADELLPLRKTCRYFFHITSSRYLWHHIFERDVTKEHRPLPSYRKPLAELGTTELEILTRRALRLDAPCQQPTLTSFHRQQPVQWVRLVYGQWMLVASGVSSSTLALYSLTVMENGKPAKLAAVDLPGPASSGEYQVQDDRLIVALCFQSPKRMTRVFSVQSRNGTMEFATLSTLDGVSHIRCLRNDLLGCSAHGSTTAPCIANWKTGKVAPLPMPPHACGQALAMALREDICVVVSPSSLTVYSISPDGSAEDAQVIQLEHPVGNVSISAEGEALALDEPADVQAPTRMLLFTALAGGINVLRLRQRSHSRTSPPSSSPASRDEAPFSVDVLAQEDVKRGDVLSAKPSQPHFGGSTARLAWIYPPASIFDRSGASLVTGRFVARDKADARFEILSECKSLQLPSFSLMPVVDYDDGAGLVALGNAMGELVVCNYGGPLDEAVARCFRHIPVPIVSA